MTSTQTGGLSSGGDIFSRFHLKNFSGRLTNRSLIGVLGWCLMLMLLGIDSVSAAEAADMANIEPDKQQPALAAFLIVVCSVFIPWMLNYVSPGVRTMGTLLASLSCFTIVAWFVFTLSTGVIDNPKPAVIPTDAAKPLLMWTLASVALVAGCFLLLLSVRQSRRRDSLALPLRNENARYGKISRYLHWTTALLFLSLIPMGIFTTMIPEDASFRLNYYIVHKTIGVTVFCLVLIRLWWNFLSRRPALDPSLSRWERRLAHGVHIALYGLMLGFPLTGFVMTTFHGYPTFFFLWEVPVLWSQNPNAVLIWGVVHKVILPYVFFVIIGGHILGALKHQFIDKHEGAFKRIVS